MNWDHFGDVGVCTQSFPFLVQTLSSKCTLSVIASKCHVDMYVVIRTAALCLYFRNVYQYKCLEEPQTEFTCSESSPDLFFYKCVLVRSVCIYFSAKLCCEKCALGKSVLCLCLVELVMLKCQLSEHNGHF